MGKKNAAAKTSLYQNLVTMVGRRADDPELIAFVSEVLGQKVPATVRDNFNAKYVSAKKHGVELLFGHDIKNERYPLIYKSKTSLIPYLQLVWLQKKFIEPLPFGLEIGISSEEITKRMGVPPGVIGAGNHQRPFWQVVLDAERSVVLEVESKVSEVRIHIQEAQEIASRFTPAQPLVGLFLAWAISRNLIDETQFATHTDLLTAIRRRERQGSDLLAAALPRSLWSIHLKDLPRLRNRAFSWFHNIGGSYIVFDLIAVFGSREGLYGHDEPILDDDNWQAVDRATSTLDSRFTEWVQTSP